MLAYVLGSSGTSTPFFLWPLPFLACHAVLGKPADRMLPLSLENISACVQESKVHGYFENIRDTPGRPTPGLFHTDSRRASSGSYPPAPRRPVTWGG